MKFEKKKSKKSFLLTINHNYANNLCKLMKVTQ